MRLGLNLLFLRPDLVGGTESYAARLIPALAARSEVSSLVAFVGPAARDWPLPDDSRVERVVCERAGPQIAARYLFEQTMLPRLLRRHRVDLVHSLGYTGPAFPGVPSVLAVHDLNYRVLGHLMPWHRRVALSTVVEGAMRRAARVLVLSESSKRQIAEEYPWVSRRLRVVYPGAGPVATATVSPLRESMRPYVVAFASQSPHKNIDRLLRVWRRLLDEGPRSHDLVLIGRLTPGLVAEPCPPGVRATGWIAEGAVTALLEGADGLVFPSLYEGFGLPILEAMVLGVPVTCSNASSLPEVGGSAALYFDPTNEESMERALRRFIGDATLRARLREAGYENARRFTWAATAAATMDAYREALDEVA